MSAAIVPSPSTVTPLNIPNHFAIVVDNVFDDETCDGFKTIIEGDLCEDFVTVPNRRWLMDDAELADYFTTKLKECIPNIWKGRQLQGFNSRFHLKRITVGELCAPHFDRMFSGSSASSYLSVVMCLNDNDSTAGGDYKFLRYDDLDTDVIVAAKKGRVIIFEHTLLHTRLPVMSGSRHVLRTDVMYWNASVNNAGKESEAVGMNSFRII